MSDTTEMSQSIYLLIHLLRYINDDDTIQVTNNQYDREHPLIVAILHLANEVLIGEDGHPVRENIDKVISKGFPIYPGEMDRFGWLTGCIELSRGIILFG
jgi:hypothetical protein